MEHWIKMGQQNLEISLITCSKIEQIVDYFPVYQSPLPLRHEKVVGRGSGCHLPEILSSFKSFYNLHMKNFIRACDVIIA